MSCKQRSEVLCHIFDASLIYVTKNEGVEEWKEDERESLFFIAFILSPLITSTTLPLRMKNGDS